MLKMATKDADLASLRIDRSFQRGNSPRKSRTKRKILIAFVLALILAAALLFLRDLFDTAVEVQLATAALTSPSQTQTVLTASGYVVARRKAAVASKGTGRLVLLNVEEGDQVKKGQLIARLEDADVVAARERARQSLLLAEADLYDAKTSYERTRILLKQGMIAQADYDVAEARYKRVVASIDVARFVLKEAEVAVDNTRIIAPFDGTVLKKNADVGEIVAPLAGAASSKAAVVTIADMSSLEVDADVSEANIIRVAPEQQCEITIDAYPQQRYPGYVTNIVPTADRSKATVLVKIRFKEYDQQVLPEMSAKISFLAIGYKADNAAHKLLLTVPEAAVATRAGRAVIYQIRDDRAVEVPVSTHQKLGGLIEIKSGIKEGDKIIAKVDDRIEAGAKVAVKGP
jgi:RND family efflux transporter MFP subunit